MVELLNEFPPHVVAYRAKGKVTVDEYRTIVMRKVDEVTAVWFGIIPLLNFMN